VISLARRAQRFAVDQEQGVLLAQAADVDRGRLQLAAGAALDGHAGNVLQRIGHVTVVFAFQLLLADDRDRSRRVDQLLFVARRGNYAVVEIDGLGVGCRSVRSCTDGDVDGKRGAKEKTVTYVQRRLEANSPVFQVRMVMNLIIK